LLISIEQVKVKDRIRKDFGNIEELANDIKENGLINPPVVTPEYELIAGERRLRACKHLGFKQIEVRVMTVKDYEHQLKLEISENENRKDFTFSERIEYARKLEEVEKIKAKERMNLGQKSDEGGRSDTIVADKSGFGSRDTLRKAKFISENADEELIKQLDEGKLSINKAYQTLKQQKEQLEISNQLLQKQYNELSQKLQLEKNKPPKVVDKTDYNSINNLNSQLNKIKQEKDEYYNKYIKSLNDLQEEQKKVSKFMGNSTNFELVTSTSELTLKMINFIKEMSKYDYLAETFNDIPDATRKEYVRSIYGVYKWARNILNEVKYDDVLGVNGQIIENIKYVEVDINE